MNNDALSDIMELLRLKAAIYFMKDFHAPWGMKIDAGEYAQLHVIVRGNCRVKLADTPEPVMLVGGDIVVFPHGHGHWLADADHSEKLNGRDVVQSISNSQPVFENGQFQTTIICGHFKIDHTFKHPLISSLPAMMHIKSSNLQNPGWMDSLLKYLVRESGAAEAGSAIISQKLAEVLFIEILRSYIRGESETLPFLSSLNDEKISHALHLIHRSPGNNWTLESLGREIGMSRAGFAIKFREMVGDTPNHYLYEWRMNTARRLLLEKRETLLEIAEQVGYVSEASFSRAFKKQFKQNPGAMRRALNKSSA